MSEFKGTKGKWDFGQKHTDQIKNIYSVYSNGNLIHSGLNSRTYSHITSSESKANSLLISHAPDLLKMLIDARQPLLDAGFNVDELIESATNIK